MKDARAREIIEKIAEKIGHHAWFGYSIASLDSKAYESEPISKKQLRESFESHNREARLNREKLDAEIRDMRELIWALAAALNLELFEGKEFRPKQKSKSKKSHVRN